MSKRDDAILAREIGKIGKGPGLGGLGSSIGARFAARFLPTETFVETLPLKVAPDRALKLGFLALTKIGKLQTDENSTPAYPSLKAVVGSGYFNLNPAIVYLEILNGDATSCEVAITAAAKEGLIKQQTAGKAARRVVSELKKLLGET